MSTTEQNTYSFTEQMNLDNNKVLYNVNGELYFICKDSEMKALTENIPVPDPTSMQWDTNITDIKTAIDSNENNENIIIDTVSILPNNIVPAPPSPPVTSNNITIKFYDGSILLKTIVIPKGTTIPEDEVPPLPRGSLYWTHIGSGGNIDFKHKTFTEDCNIYPHRTIIIPPGTDDMED